MINIYHRDISQIPIYSKFHENEAIHDKQNFKQGLTMIFEVKQLESHLEKRFKILQANFL